MLLAKAPGSVRFEALSPFGQPLLIAIVHDGPAHRLQRGDQRGDRSATPTAETTARLLSLPFEPRGSRRGGVRTRGAARATCAWARSCPPTTLGPSLSLVGAVHEQRIWMDFQTGVVRQLQIIGGRAAATVTYQRDDEGR